MKQHERIAILFVVLSLMLAQSCKTGGSEQESKIEFSKSDIKTLTKFSQGTCREPQKNGDDVEVRCDMSATEYCRVKAVNRETTISHVVNGQIVNIHNYTNNAFGLILVPFSENRSLALGKDLAQEMEIICVNTPKVPQDRTSKRPKLIETASVFQKTENKCINENFVNSYFDFWISNENLKNIMLQCYGREFSQDHRGDRYQAKCIKEGLYDLLIDSNLTNGNYKEKILDECW